MSYPEKLRIGSQPEDSGIARDRALPSPHIRYAALMLLSATVYAVIVVAAKFQGG